MKTILLSLDGLLDSTYEVLGNKTPLEYANTPNLDKLLQNGACGVLKSHNPGIPTSLYADVFTMAGYNARDFPGIGVVKALGEDLEINENSIYMECFFTSVVEDSEGFRVVDRKITDISEEELDQLRSVIPNYYEGYEFHLRKCNQSTCVISMSDNNGWISDKISDSDPYFPSRHVNKVVPVFELCAAGSECKRAKNTADALNKFLLRVNKLLDSHEVNERRKRRGKYPVNFLLTRFSSKYVDLPSFNEKTGMKTISISDIGLVKGLSKLLKVDYLIAKDSKDVFESTVRYLDHYDIIYAKTTYLKDASLKYDPLQKASEIEKLDSYLEPFTKLNDTLIMVFSSKVYPFIGSLVNSGEEYSLIMSGKNVRKDEIVSFNERNCYKGNLRISHNEILNLILNYTNKALLYGLRPGSYVLNYIPTDEDIEHLM